MSRLKQYQNLVQSKLTKEVKFIEYKVDFIRYEARIALLWYECLFYESFFSCLTEFIAYTIDCENLYCVYLFL